MIFKNWRMKKLLIYLVLLLFFACNKSGTIPIPPVIAGPLVYKVNTLDSFSAINKTTSWYSTTKAMTSLFDVFLSNYWGFELTLVVHSFPTIEVLQALGMHLKIIIGMI